MSVTPVLTMRLGKKDRKKLSVISKRLGTNLSQTIRLMIRSSYKNLAGTRPANITLKLDMKKTEE